MELITPRASRSLQREPLFPPERDSPRNATFAGTRLSKQRYFRRHATDQEPLLVPALHSTGTVGCARTGLFWTHVSYGGRRSFQCGSQAFFNTDNGTISSHSGIDHGHNYGKDLDCVWTIEAPKGKMVELTSLMFDIENGGIACNYDWLELFDGNSTNSTSLGRFCGSTFRPISSTQRFLTLNFVTDGSTQQRGFKLFYNFTDHVV
ncbi:CUBN-like protein, partial [Mya arenaria]